jgi:hypothetical protein
MLKDFVEGFSKKAGEAAATWLIPVLLAVAASAWVWLKSPIQLEVSRGEFIAFGALAIVLILLAYALGFLIAKRRYVRKAPEIDSLQRDILRFLWGFGSVWVPLESVRKLTKAHHSDVILASERLTELGFVYYSHNGDLREMQLRMEGREYVKAHNIDKGASERLIDRLRELDN